MKKLTVEEKIAILEHAKKKLGRGGRNWVKCTWFGKNRFMDICGPMAEDAKWSEATCFCLEGAIEVSAYELGFKNKPEERDTATVAVSVKDYVFFTHHYCSANLFNDRFSTTWKDVLEVINGRIKQLRKETAS